MKVSPSSKITPQTIPTTHLGGRCVRGKKWVVGLGTSLLMVTVFAQTPKPTQDDEVMTREQILALFEREAKAAYQIAQEACATLSGEELKRCLAQARLQYDADRRYARKRADQGF